jgi:hypothetical protein
MPVRAPRDDGTSEICRCASLTGLSALAGFAWRSCPKRPTGRSVPGRFPWGVAGWNNSQCWPRCRKRLLRPRPVARPVPHSDPSLVYGGVGWGAGPLVLAGGRLAAGGGGVVVVARLVVGVGARRCGTVSGLSWWLGWWLMGWSVPLPAGWVVGGVMACHRRCSIVGWSSFRPETTPSQLCWTTEEVVSVLQDDQTGFVEV